MTFEAGEKQPGFFNSVYGSKMADGASAYKQEMPPKGGYATFNIARNLKQRGPSGFMTFVIGTGVVLGGFLVIRSGNIKRR